MGVYPELRVYPELSVYGEPVYPEALEGNQSRDYRGTASSAEQSRSTAPRACVEQSRNSRRGYGLNENIKEKRIR